jgi:REP element-mobilizing transposase RayT
MICAVVMPDHVHLLYYPSRDSQGLLYSLEEVLGGIKGASAHSINKQLRRKGHVWQDESQDHVIRSIYDFNDKLYYIMNNPVKKGLADKPEGYPWLWVASDESSESQPRAAVPQDSERQRTLE